MSIRYRRLDGVTLTLLEPDACPHAWQLYRQSHDPLHGPDSGLVEVMLYLTSAGHWVEYRTELDPYREWTETCIEIDRTHAVRKLAEIGATIPDEIPPIECSQAELGAAMGKGRHYTRLMERLSSIADCKRISPHRWQVRFRDPDRHRTIFAEIERRTPLSRNRRIGCR